MKKLSAILQKKTGKSLAEAREKRIFSTWISKGKC